MESRYQSLNLAFYWVKTEVERMNIEQIKEKLKTSEYDFLREDKNLGDNIILLTLGES